MQDCLVDGTAEVARFSKPQEHFLLAIYAAMCKAKQGCKVCRFEASYEVLPACSTNLFCGVTCTAKQHPAVYTLWRERGSPNSESPILLIKKLAHTASTAEVLQKQ